MIFAFPHPLCRGQCHPHLASALDELRDLAEKMLARRDFTPSEGVEAEEEFCHSLTLYFCVTCGGYRVTFRTAPLPTRD